MSLCRICTTRHAVDDGRCQPCLDYYLVRGYERPLVWPVTIKKRRIVINPGIRKKKSLIEEEDEIPEKAEIIPWQLGMPKRKARRKAV